MMTLHENALCNVKRRKADKIISKINKGKFTRPFFLVVFSESTKRLEIYNSLLFKEAALRKLPLTVVFITKAYDDACEYIRQICDISMKNFGELKLIDTIDILQAGDIDI